MDPEVNSTREVADGLQAEPRLRAKLLELLAEIQDIEVELPEEVEKTLAEMERFQEDNPRMWNISREGGKILYYLAKKFGCQNILEIGTSNGYSAIWLAQAAKENGGHVVSHEKRSQKVEMANQNISKAGLEAFVDVQTVDVNGQSAETKEQIDLLFLDILPEEYLEILKKLLPELKTTAVIVSDNLTSNRYQSGDAQVSHDGSEEYLDFVKNNKNMASTILDVGSGLQIIIYENNETGAEVI